MGSFLHLNWSVFCCRTLRSWLALIWCVGMLFGALASLTADISYSSTMHAALFGSLSISGLLAALLLPLLITAFAVYFSKPIWILPLAFLKAFMFAFTATGLMVSFGSAGWLVRLLLMFSDTLVLPILWLVWLLSLESGSDAAFRYCLPAAAFIFLICCFDFTVVAPFLARLI